MRQSAHNPKVPGNAAGIRAHYDAVLACLGESTVLDAENELRRVHKDLRRRILARMLDESMPGGRMGVNESLLTISDAFLADALDKVRNRA